MNELLKYMIEENKDKCTSYSNPEVIGLYSLVDNYVKATNYCEYGENGVYYIMQDGIGFEIGVSYGPDIFYYVNRVDMLNEDYFIDMKYVPYNIIPVKQAIIRNELYEIQRRIEELNKKGVPKQLIKRYINL